MKTILKNLNFRRLKLTDYIEFKSLFYSCFKKNISYNFFKWRYFEDKFSFCYGAFYLEKLIANVGMVSIKLNNTPKDRILSRHSSMVLEDYRGIGVFSELLKQAKKKIPKQTSFVVMWPNKNNFANFGIKNQNIKKKKFFIYQTSSNNNYFRNKKNYSIDELIKLKKNITNNNSFFFKNFNYFKKRYLSYRKKDYFINKFEYKGLKSFFIIKYNKNKSVISYVILDHFGSNKIISKHISNIIKNQNKIIFLSKKKINMSNSKLINTMSFKIGSLKKKKFIQKKKILSNKEIFLGDTDIFITI